MTNQEFSNAFDTLLNSYNLPASFGEDSFKGSINLDEYEKSIFLTEAQEELVISLYNGRNSLGTSFEGTEELRRYLSNLVKVDTKTPITTSNGKELGINSSSKFFTLPSDLWFITYEAVKVSDPKCKDLSVLQVYPVRQDEYHIIKNNPFRGINDRRALRLDLSEGNIEIVCKYTVTEYYLRYIKKVNPIILEDLPMGLTIKAQSNKRECELHEALHNKILELAVIKALQSKGYNLNKENTNS